LSQAIALAKFVNYQSAGTVEFLVDDGGKSFFLEMNTRIQVEHTVTECITGLDLVEQMIRIAYGQQLAFSQSEIKRFGWAIQCRICSEDPLRKFIPSTGRLIKYLEPSFIGDKTSNFSPKLRIDTGVTEGAEISSLYDSMIAKLIVHHQDRIHAIEMMCDALNGFLIRGVHTNLNFLSALMMNHSFASGNLHTDFIDEYFPQSLTPQIPSEEVQEFLAALAACAHLNPPRQRQLSPIRQNEITPEIEQEYVVALRFGLIPIRYFAVQLIMRRKNLLILDVEGNPYKVSLSSKATSLIFSGQFNSHRFTAFIDRFKFVDSPWIGVTYNGISADCLVMARHVSTLYKLMPPTLQPELARRLSSPLPGLLVRLIVSEGQVVTKGQTLAEVDAMKMINPLFAEQDGVVTGIYVAEGDRLSPGQVIMEFGSVAVTS
jgi:propionyl-CoA carboxylase alpha chain